MLIAIEGIDASGKATQTRLLETRIRNSGLSVATISFPRYGQTLFAGMVADYLNGRFGSLLDVPPQFSALLYAGDRFESRSLIAAVAQSHDVLVLDRYSASNLAHQAAKVSSENQNDFIAWLDCVEHEIYELPRPDRTVYLDIPVDLASQLQFRKHQRAYTNDAADLHEKNRQYLRACREVYLYLANANFGSRWLIVHCTDSAGDLRSPSTISDSIWDEIADAVSHSGNQPFAVG